MRGASARPFLNEKLRRTGRFEWRKIDKYPRVYAIRFSRPLILGGNHRAMKIIQKFLADESGATAIEYGLIAAGIALAIIVVVNGLGAKLNTKFTAINNSLK
jgi:pilus assembly protein Flp/PilA